LSAGGAFLRRDSEDEIFENIDSSINSPKERVEEWIPTLTFRQRVVAGSVLGAIFMIISLVFWEVSFEAALIVALVFFVLSIILGEKFVKFIAFVAQYFGFT
jgi:hypothetical protein